MAHRVGRSCFVTLRAESRLTVPEQTRTLHDNEELQIGTRCQILCRAMELREVRFQTLPVAKKKESHMEDRGGNGKVILK